MFYMLQRKIRIATANRLRHLKADLDFLQIGDSRRGKLMEESFEALVETMPQDPDELRITIESKGEIRLRGFEKMENRMKTELEAELEKSQLYQVAFKPIPGCGPGIAGFVIAAIQDIRSYPNFGKLKAKAGYHLVSNGQGGFMAPKPRKGERSNWDKKFQQAVYYFTTCVDKQNVHDKVLKSGEVRQFSVWKRQLEARKLKETEKLLVQFREKGKDIPVDMTVEKFISMYQNVQSEATASGESFGRMPKAYAGLRDLARKRALRWLGQKFLQHVWDGWRLLEGLGHPTIPLFPSTQVSAPYLLGDETDSSGSDFVEPTDEELDNMPDPEEDQAELEEVLEMLE